jgi:hypothetical protein
VNEKALMETQTNEPSSILIWWTNQDDAEQFGVPYTYCFDKCPLPDYIKKQFASRYGRAGRGRLWVDESINVKEIEWNDESPLSDYCNEAAGILFDSSDLNAMRRVPGVITDLNLIDIEDNRTPNDGL